MAASEQAERHVVAEDRLSNLFKGARAIAFAELDGWAEDDHVAALRVLQDHCKHRFEGVAASAAEKVCPFLAASQQDSSARQFFEDHFIAIEISSEGFLTGYFEPELPASRQPTKEFAVPLLGPPEGLVSIQDGNRPVDWPDRQTHGRATPAGIIELPDRGAIMDGALSGQGLELVWLKNPIDAFFVHVQGSARLRLTNGSVMRVGYAGKTGHPYTSIARVLVKSGAGTPEQFTMSGLRDWLEANPDESDALMRENRSYIFFREIEIESEANGPVGSAGVSLTAMRSLAVDPDHIPLGLPVFVQSDAPVLRREGKPFQRLMIAEDTGSAIKGPARGDVFVGSGEEAGETAGEIRHSGQFVVLVPKDALATGDEPGALR
ncbi:transglycosylase [Roseibium sp. RKSG952]|nr:transglycosylase [Roseibium sp. RKSG952]